jgi:hypothetical protein
LITANILSLLFPGNRRHQPVLPDQDRERFPLRCNPNRLPTIAPTRSGAATAAIGRITNSMACAQTFADDRRQKGRIVGFGKVRAARLTAWTATPAPDQGRAACKNG